MRGVICEYEEGYIWRWGGLCWQGVGIELLGQLQTFQPMEAYRQMWGKQEERRTWKNIERISGILTFGIFSLTIHYTKDNFLDFPPIERISLGMLLFSTCQIETHLVFWLPSLDKFFREKLFGNVCNLGSYLSLHLIQHEYWILFITEVAKTTFYYFTQPNSTVWLYCNRGKVQKKN